MAAIARLTDNVRGLKSTPGSIGKFTDEITKNMGSTFTFGGRNYRIGKVKPGDDMSKLEIEDIDIPNSRTSFGQVLDDLYPPIQVNKGIPRLSTVDFEAKVRRSITDSGAPAKQVDAMTKAEMQRTMNSPAVTRLSSIDNAATAADNAVAAGGRKLDAAAEGKVVQNATKVAKMDQWTSQPLFQTAVRNIDPQTIARSADGIARATDGATTNWAKTLDEASLKDLKSRGDLNFVEQVRNKMREKGVLTPQIVKQLDTVSKDIAKKARASTTISIPVAGILTFTVLIGVLVGLSVGAPQSAQKGTPGVAQAAAGTPFPALSDADRIGLYMDTISLVIVAAAQQHQKDMNGCWLYNKVEGTLTKVKLLTCGHFAATAELETCATQAYTPGNDAAIVNCPAGTFNPCLKSSTQRTTNLSTPTVPNVCNAYLYNGSTPPLGVAGVTTTAACAGVPAEQACSSYCKTELFNLPPTMQLICVDMDFATAYADLMSQLGYSPSELFVSTQAKTPVPVAPSRSKVLWVLGGVAVAVLLAAAGYVFMRRRKQEHTSIETRT